MCSTWVKHLFLLVLPLLACANELNHREGLPLYYWNEQWKGRIFENFGDILSKKLVERIIGAPVRIYNLNQKPEKKLLASGSLLYFARDNDILWGTGFNAKKKKNDFKF